MIVVKNNLQTYKVYSVSGGWVCYTIYTPSCEVYFIDFAGNCRKIVGNYLLQENNKLFICKSNWNYGASSTKEITNGIDGDGRLVDPNDATEIFKQTDLYRVKAVKFEQDELIGILLGLSKENDLGIGFIGPENQTKFLALSKSLFGIKVDEIDGCYKGVEGYLRYNMYGFNYSFSPNYQTVLIWLQAPNCNFLILDNPFV